MSDADKRSLARLSRWVVWIYVAATIVGGGLEIGGTLWMEATLAGTAAADSTLVTIWWTLVVGLIAFFPFADAGLLLLFVLFEQRFARDDPFMRLIVVSATVWMTIALVADAWMLGFAAVHGLMGFDGIDQARVVYAEYTGAFMDQVRFLFRGYYFGMGATMAAFAWLVRRRGWPRALARLSRLMAFAYGIEIISFVVMAVYGSSPLQGPGFILLFMIAGPLWAWRIGRSLSATGSAPR